MRELSAEAWKEFRANFQLANERLAGEMAGAWEDVRSLIEQLRNHLDSITQGEAETGAVAFYDWLFRDASDQLFGDPLGTFEKFRPIGRTLLAIEKHRLEMNDLARTLPRMTAISGTELVAILGSDAHGRLRKAWMKHRKSAQPLRLRRIVLANMWAQIERRAPIDEEFERLLARAGLHLMAAWQLYRRHQLAAETSGGRDAAALAEERKWWLRNAARLVARAGRLVHSYRHWAENYPALLSQSVLRRVPEVSEKRQGRIVRQWDRDFSEWHRQYRAVRAAVDLERKLIAVARETIQATRHSLESVRAEHDDVAEEMDRAIAWLQAGPGQRSDEKFPPPKARLLPAGQRARDWAERVSFRVQQDVLADVEAVRPSRVLERWRSRWRQLGPRAVVLHAFKHSGLEAAREGFREVETEHTAVIRDIEQARQVVAFALEVARSNGAEVEAIPREAAANALALLEHRREIQGNPQPAAEAGLCRAQALALLETHTALEFGQLGLFALVTRQSAPRAARNLWQAGLDFLRAASRTVYSLTGNAFHWIAWKLGWERPVEEHVEALVERTPLSVVLEAQLRPRNLPALYERLFSLAPVEDQRFLVGREVEMTGLSRAFSLWQSGQRASVLLAGDRGSGKTSLLNCASVVAFPGVPVVRAQFSERIRSPQQMDEFFRDLFQLPAGADLAGALDGQRQVVILEEFERTFLRCMNGFEALRGFLRLMSATSGSILWILSMNRVSFRYLDAVVGLGRNFSHHINAMSVTQEHMTDAVIQRHTLSGLRLHFAPVAPGEPRINKVRQFVGLEQTPQDLFFNALYRQSEGLFRSAFELWLGSIDRIEGAMVRMLHPLDPNYKGLEAELAPEDLFILQAIFQHSSLTPEELAEVFTIGFDDARHRLERLEALEIVEPEPAFPGLRVRPQAGRFVRDALERQNLL